MAVWINWSSGGLVYFVGGLRRKLARRVCVSLCLCWEVRFHLTGGGFPDDGWIVQILPHKEDFAANISASHLITVSLSPPRRSLLRCEKSSLSSASAPAARPLL